MDKLQRFIPVSCTLAFLVLAGLVYGQQAPLLDVPRIDSSGSLTLTLHGLPGTNYAVEYSDDLKSWWPHSVGLATNAVLQFKYAPPTGAAASYFRARVDVPLPPITVAYQEDTNSLDVALVTPEEGGSLSLTDTNGVTYTLTVPTNAITEPQVFELTLVTNISGLPFTGPNLGVITLSPAGLVLSEAAQLVVTFPTNQVVDPIGTVGYAFNDDGSYLRLSLVSADTNSIRIPVFELSGFGCSVATLAEVKQMTARPVGDVKFTNGPLVKTMPTAHHQPRSVYTSTILDQCYPADLARAREIDDYLQGELEILIASLVANSKQIERNRPDLGGDPKTWASQGFNWNGNGDFLYSASYVNGFVPYLEEAESNCALTEVLARRLSQLRSLAAQYGGTVLLATGADQYLCAGYQHCFKELEDCCQNQGLGGPPTRQEARMIAAFAAYYGSKCSLPDPSQVAKACEPTWSGSISVVQVLTLKTNYTEGSITTFDTMTEVATVVYESDKNGLAGQSGGPGLYGLTGNLNASGACAYNEVTVTVDSSCCGACTTTTQSHSACTPKGTAQGAFAWWLTNSPPSPVPLPVSMYVLPGNDLTLATHGVKRPVHTTYTLSYRQSDPHGSPTCVTKTDHNNFTGKYDFSGIPFLNFQNAIQGTTSSFSGSYETNIVRSDGVSTVRIQANWNFQREL